MKGFNKAMKLERTDNLDKVDELCACYPYITEPTGNAEERDFFLLKQDEEVVGCGYVRVFLEEIGNIGALFVKEDWRGNGAGSFLQKKLEEKLEERGAKVCLVGVYTENEIGEKFYEDEGYHVLLEGVGEDWFEKAELREILDKVSPKPLPDKSVIILGKRLDVDEKENTHPLKEIYDLEDFLKSLKEDLLSGETGESY